MRILNCLGVVSFLALASCDSALSPDEQLAQVLAKNAEARGGAEALADVRSVKINVHIKEPAFEVDGVYRASREGKMRIDIYVEGTRVFTEAFDGERGWQMFGDGTVGAMSEKGEQAVRHGIYTNLLPLSEMAAYGQTVTSAGMETIAGVGYYAIDLAFDDGHVNHYLVDPGTFLVAAQREEKAIHPDVDATTEVFLTAQLDYRTVNGVSFPFRTEMKNLASGEVVQTTQVETLEVNPELDPALFAVPE